MLTVKALWNCAMPTWPQLKRSGKVIWRSLSSRTFVILVAAPFVAWALLLMWVRFQFPDDVGRVVAVGPGVLVLGWAAMVATWFSLTLGRAPYRHSLAVALAFLVLVAVTLKTLPPPKVAAATSAPTHSSEVR